MPNAWIKRMNKNTQMKKQVIQKEEKGNSNHKASSAELKWKTGKIQSTMNNKKKRRSYNGGDKMHQQRDEEMIKMMVV